MITSLALIYALAANPFAPAEKASLVHKFTKGETISFEMDVKSSSSSPEINMNALLDIAVGDKTEKGTDVTVKPKQMKMTFNGQDMDHSEATEVKYVLDEHGMPTTIAMNDEASMMTIPLVLSYMPNKELEVGETFEIKAQDGETKYSGTGKLESIETQGEKQIAKVSVKSTLSVKDSPDGVLEFVVSFDPTAGKVISATGTVSMDSQAFKFTLIRK